MKLDDLRDRARVDRSDALGDVLSYSRQWAEAATASRLRLTLDDVDAVVVTGMGGSGICGDVLAALAADRLPVPVVVHKGYGLPAFAGSATLVVAVSYSGTTEETLSAYDAAVARGTRIFAVASGGVLADRCRQEDVVCVRVPPGRQPRHSLGYLLVPALVALGLDDGLDEAVEVLARLEHQLGPDVACDENPAKRLAAEIADGWPDVLPLALGGHGIGSLAAYRLKCQLNENAKLPVLAGELPEADHNEVVAWQQVQRGASRPGLVELRDPLGEHERVGRRFGVTAELLAPQVAWRRALVACGDGLLARAASLLLQVDLVSVYTALALDVDPTPVDAIDRLKAALA